MQLDRFIAAQSSPHAGLETALGELKAGQKTSHWIWYVFPQLKVLGRSETARFYGIANVLEAEAYLRDVRLRNNLVDCLEIVETQLSRGVALTELMGGETDSMKLVSCATLFEQVTKRIGVVTSKEVLRVEQLCAAILEMAEKQGFARCETTRRECDADPA
jgi:uncharacterized protein (DUF1810 family)